MKTEERAESQFWKYLDLVMVLLDLVEMWICKRRRLIFTFLKYAQIPNLDTFPLFFVLGSHCPAATNSKTLQSSSPFQDVRRSGVRSNSTSTLDDDTATSPAVTTTVGAARQLSGAVDEMRSVDGGVATVLAAASIMDSTALSATS